MYCNKIQQSSVRGIEIKLNKKNKEIKEKESEMKTKNEKVVETDIEI